MIIFAILTYKNEFDYSDSKNCIEEVENKDWKSIFLLFRS